MQRLLKEAFGVDGITDVEKQISRGKGGMDCNMWSCSLFSRFCSSSTVRPIFKRILSDYETQKSRIEIQRKTKIADKSVAEQAARRAHRVGTLPVGN